MKKNYIIPKFETIELRANQTLLAGSIKQDTINDTYSVSGLGNRQEGDEDL